ncbi:hypothetical protein DPMN_095768 [Dreissena polymorpha]|uniref:Uncharacterized protein n=1 Tax=Dreissena polymorpha TaxID=45954 RepID=A0A9D4R4U6_DREPO|nr:hypothetical protein DPMN_095768 [Dreissena polymorpha]
MVWRVSCCPYSIPPSTQAGKSNGKAKPIHLCTSSVARIGQNDVVANIRPP